MKSRLIALLLLSVGALSSACATSKNPKPLDVLEIGGKAQQYGHRLTHSVEETE